MNSFNSICQPEFSTKSQYNSLRGPFLQSVKSSENPAAPPVFERSKALACTAQGLSKVKRDPKAACLCTAYRTARIHAHAPQRFDHAAAHHHLQVLSSRQIGLCCCSRLMRSLGLVFCIFGLISYSIGSSWSGAALPHQFDTTPPPLHAPMLIVNPRSWHTTPDPCTFRPAAAAAAAARGRKRACTAYKLWRRHSPHPADAAACASGCW